ncbi:MAG: hypothetical protein ACMXX7_01545 [Candidatus Woesearchaeota archaeon]
MVSKKINEKSLNTNFRRDIIIFLKEALSIPSVTGFTNSFTNFLINKFEELNLKSYNVEDALIIYSKKNSKKNCFCAHLDRIGFVKNKNHLEYSTLYYKQKDKSFNKDIKFLEKIKNRFIGEIIKSKENHKIKTGVIQNNKVLFSISTSLEDKFYTLSSKVNYDSYNISCQLDNIISIAVLYIICKNKDFEGTLIFSKNEEIGQSFHGIINSINKFKLDPKKIFVLDTTTQVSNNNFEKGLILINSKEKDAFYNKKLHQYICKIAKENNIPYESDICKSTTELYRIVKNSDNKYSGITIRIPRKNYHTSNEETSFRCIENYFKLVSLIIK